VVSGSGADQEAGILLCVGLAQGYGLASLRGGEPGRTEQWFFRPTEWGFARPAIVLLDHGMKKPSMI
jgi:hypothetical protein